MGKKLLRRKEREDGIEFKLYEYGNGKVYRIMMDNKIDGRSSEYGEYYNKEEAIKDLEELV